MSCSLLGTVRQLLLRTATSKTRRWLSEKHLSLPDLPVRDAFAYPQGFVRQVSALKYSPFRLLYGLGNSTLTACRRHTCQMRCDLHVGQEMCP